MCTRRRHRHLSARCTTGCHTRLAFSGLLSCERGALHSRPASVCWQCGLRAHTRSLGRRPREGRRICVILARCFSHISGAKFRTAVLRGGELLGCLPFFPRLLLALLFCFKLSLCLLRAARLMNLCSGKDRSAPVKMRKHPQQGVQTQRGNTSSFSTRSRRARKRFFWRKRSRWQLT